MDGYACRCIIFTSVANVKGLFFTVGVLFFIVGCGVFILYNFKLFPLHFFTQNTLKLATGLEVIFLSLSMSNLIWNLENKKNESNRIALFRSEEINDQKLKKAALNSENLNFSPVKVFGTCEK